MHTSQAATAVDRGVSERPPDARRGEVAAGTPLAATPIPLLTSRVAGGTGRNGGLPRTGPSDRPLGRRPDRADQAAGVSGAR
jgi:hypothetical protein